MNNPNLLYPAMVVEGWVVYCVSTKGGKVLNNICLIYDGDTIHKVYLPSGISTDITKRVIRDFIHTL